MVNLRQRAVAKSPAKRTSSRATTTDYEKIKIDSDDSSEDILFDDEETSEVEEKAKKIVKEEPDILDGYASDKSSSDDISIDSSSEDEEKDDFDVEAGDESEDDKEIRRIIEKTEAETRNIPLTARQRAKLEGGIQDPLQSVQPEVDVISNEQALKMSEKSRRRKLQRAQKIEETKRATIDRLLQKQKKTPAANSAAEEAAVKEAEKRALDDESLLKPGTMRYIDRSTETVLQFPDDSTYHSVVADFVPKPLDTNRDRKCQICEKDRCQYTHPTNGKSFCSIACYKLIK